MYSHALIVGVAGVFLALVAFLWVILARRVVNAPVPGVAPPGFSDEFVGELTRLSQQRLPEPVNSVVRATPKEDAYTLHQRGESPSRIAARLGIGKADAELLIKIAEARKS